MSSSDQNGSGDSISSDILSTVSARIMSFMVQSSSSINTSITIYSTTIPLTTSFNKPISTTTATPSFTAARNLSSSYSVTASSTTRININANAGASVTSTEIAAAAAGGVILVLFVALAFLVMFCCCRK